MIALGVGEARRLLAARERKSRVAPLGRVSESKRMYNSPLPLAFPAGLLMVIVPFTKLPAGITIRPSAATG